MIEWPDGEAEPTKYWLSTLPDDIAMVRMVELTKLRWRIERDYQDLKQELGLGHYEGRGWRGFHHHATLCIAAYGFLIAERATIFPSAPGRLNPRSAHIPAGHRPRGAPDPSRTAYTELNRNDASPPHRRLGKEPRSMSLLPNTHTVRQLMTQ